MHTPGSLAIRYRLSDRHRNSKTARRLERSAQHCRNETLGRREIVSYSRAVRAVQNANCDRQTWEVSPACFVSLYACSVWPIDVAIERKQHALKSCFSKTPRVRANVRRCTDRFALVPNKMCARSVWIKRSNTHSAIRSFHDTPFYVILEQKNRSTPVSKDLGLLPEKPLFFTSFVLHHELFG